MSRAGTLVSCWVFLVRLFEGKRRVIWDGRTRKLQHRVMRMERFRSQIPYVRSIRITVQGGWKVLGGEYWARRTFCYGDSDDHEPCEGMRCLGMETTRRIY